MELFEHDGSYSIHFNGQGLMHSRTSASEVTLGTLGCDRMDHAKGGRVLIGGLGLGFTLSSVLESVGEHATVDQVELVPEIIDWNRKHLADLNGTCLEDPRAQIQLDDVTRFVRNAKPESYDAILLDVDNGAEAMVSASNSSLYSDSGVRSVRTALKPGGRAVFWSSTPDKPFEACLRKAKFTVRAVPAKVHPGAKRANYWLFVADKA